MHLLCCFFKDCCYPFLFSFNLVLINYTEWSMIPACPSLMCSFNRGYIEGTNFKNLCLIVYVLSVYVCFVSSTFRFGVGKDLDLKHSRVGT